MILLDNVDSYVDVVSTIQVFDFQRLFELCRQVDKVCTFPALRV